MNNIELNAILYYADFLSMKAISQPVSDNCKYFFIHGVPINSSYIAGVKPKFDSNNEYYKRALKDYISIRDKFDEESVLSFIDDIASLRACGMVDGIRMLKCIHQYSDRFEKNKAFSTYRKWKKSKIYTHIIKDENGDPIEQECSKYVAHHEGIS